MIIAATQQEWASYRYEESDKGVDSSNRRDRRLQSGRREESVGTWHATRRDWSRRLSGSHSLFLAIISRLRSLPHIAHVHSGAFRHELSRNMKHQVFRLTTAVLSLEVAPEGALVATRENSILGDCWPLVTFVRQPVVTWILQRTLRIGHLVNV